MTGGEGARFRFPVREKTRQRSSFEAVVVRENLETPPRFFFAIAGVGEYQQTAESMQWSLSEGSEGSCAGAF